MFKDNILGTNQRGRNGDRGQFSNETPEDTASMMLERMNKEFPGVDLKKEDIDMCHRLVQTHDGKPRPVIVKLVSRLLNRG